MQEKFGDICVTSADHIAIIEIDRPPLNHVSTASMRDLADALARIDVDTDIRCSVLKTAGKVFCAGADLSGDEDPTAQGLDGTRRLYAEAVRLFSVTKPVVALVQGAAVGAGLGLALVADFRIAAPEARFTANFVKLGFHPGFGITHTLPRLVGEQKALLMCLTGRRVKAAEALAWNLVDEVVPLDQLHEAGMALAREIAENAPLALTSIRATMRGALAAAVKSQSDLESMEQMKLRNTEDFAEGVRAVHERRSGRFTGR